MKFYHHIHPKSDEGIRLVRHARANPFASKSIFSESSEKLEIHNESGSENSNPSNEAFDIDSEPYEIHVSFPNEASPVNIPTYADTSSTLITQSPTIQQTNSNSSTPLSQLISPSPIQSRSCITTGPTISCQVLSIGINLAVTCNNLPSISAPQETTCIITRHDEDVLYISIPNLTLNDTS